MPPKSSTRKGGKKGMSHTLSPDPSSSPIRKKQKGTPSAIRDRANSSSRSGIPKLEPSSGAHPPSEYWNQLTDFQRDFLDGAMQETVSNLYDLGAEIKAETSSPAPSSIINDENESQYSLGTPVPGPIPAPFPYTVDDLTLCHAPTADPTGYPIFVSRNGRWDWYYLSSNTKTTETPANGTSNGNTTNTKKSSPPKVKMEDIPEANPRVQRPSNPLSTTFSATDLDHFVFHGLQDSDDDENIIERARTENIELAKTVKHVKFFMNNSHDKHFVPFQVPALIGYENWEPWLAGMYLLFRQHSVWPVVTAELEPLPPGHNLHLWYNRMLDCAVALIYANVSDVVRNTHCLMSTLHDDDPDELMAHLYAHYAEPDLTHPPHEESELD
ncbi:Dipeptidyl-peptidase 5 [Penicillium rubens]|nr:Dipeptidyl-peptidase 5 [Penicillium rubens]